MGEWASGRQNERMRVAHVFDILAGRVMHLNPWMYPLLFLTGLAAGFVDAIAGGGGLITVPVLLATGLDSKIALGTNKLQSSCGTALALRHYARSGWVNWSELRVGFAASFGGALLGAMAVNRLDSGFLRGIVPVLLLAIAVYTLISPRLGSEASPRRLSPTAFGLGFGVILGFYDGFFGPGTGSFWTLACVGLFGLDLLRATAATKAMNLMSNLASVVVFAGAGKIDYGVAAVMAIGQMIGGRLGSGLAVRRGAKLIRPVFLSVVFAITARLLWQRFRG